MKKRFSVRLCFLAGLVSCATLLAGPTGMQWAHNGEWASVWWLLSNYELAPIFYVFVVITIIGLVIAFWGVYEKK